MALVENDLGGNVLGSAANGEGPAFIKDLGEPEIGEFQIAVICEQQVLRFQVSEDYIFVVQIFEAGSHSWSVKSGLICGEGLDRSEVGEQLASVYEF